MKLPTAPYTTVRNGLVSGIGRAGTANPRILAPRSRHHKGQSKIGSKPNRYEADGTLTTAKKRLARQATQVGRPHKAKAKKR